jgi:hypothetical protein
MSAEIRAGMTGMTGTTTTGRGRRDTSAAVAGLIRWLETGSAPAGLFAPDVFCDLSLPQWRVQAASAEEVLAIRAEGHPCPGKVRVERVEHTGRGFTIEFEERWDNEGQRWYCREMIRADVMGDSIVERRRPAKAAQQASLADSWMVLKAMDGYSAAQCGDTDTCAAVAAEAEAFASAEGVTVVCAEAAFLWVCAGKLDRARALVHTFRGPVLDELSR